MIVLETERVYEAEQASAALPNPGSETLISSVGHAPSADQSETSLPDLPIEIISNILAHAFLRPKPDTPTSDHYPLRNTTHLLLVSKAFHQLARPFLLHSITITRPQDYITFFGAETGLFVGEEGAELWKHVQRVSVVRTVYPEIRQPYGGDERLIAPRTFPTGQRIQHLTVLNNSTGRDWELFDSPEVWSRRPGAADIYRFRCSNPRHRSEALAVVHERFEARPDLTDFASYLAAWRAVNPFSPTAETEAGQLADGSDPVNAERMDDLLRRAINESIGQKSMDDVELEQHEAVEALFVAVSPVTLHDNDTDVLRFCQTAGYTHADPTRPIATIDTFVVHNVTASMMQGRDVARNAQDMLNLYGDLNRPHVHLVGFAAREINLLAAVIQDPPQEWRRPVEVKRWMWEAADDGQAYELNLTDFSTKRIDAI